MADGLSRRSILQGLAATAATVGTVSLSATPASAAAAAAQPKPKPPGTDWAAFDAAVRSAFDRMNMVGAALALVSAGEVLHTTTLGSRMLAPRRPVTTTTRFDSGSTGKSMTAAFVATYVDDGTLAWDQPVVDAWSGFRAPTDEIDPHPARARPDRDGLRPGRTALDVEPLRWRDCCPAAAVGGQPPRTCDSHVDKTFFYNNTDVRPRRVPAAAGHRRRARPTWARPAYCTAIHERAVHPGRHARGDRSAPILRGLSRRLRRPATRFDLRARAGGDPVRAVRVPTAPAGGGYVNTLRTWPPGCGCSCGRESRSTGRRVVSAANLAECWTAARPRRRSWPPELDPDAVKVGYGMGWLREEYKDGSSLVLAQRVVRRVHDLHRVPAAARPRP